MQKMFIAAVVLALGSPAFAQSSDPALGSGNLTGASSAAPSLHMRADSAFARVVPSARSRRAAAPAYDAPNAAYDESGHAAATDPDPNIRFQLHRDADSIEGF